MNWPQIAMAAGRAKVAAARLAQAADLAPDTDVYHLALAELLVAMGRPGEAIDRFRRALAMAPQQPRTLNSLGNALLAVCDYAAAQEAYRAAIALKPDYVLAYCNLGLTLLRQERWEDALRPLGIACEMAPDLAAAHLSRATALTGLKRYTEAAAAADAARNLEPRNPVVHDTLGRIRIGQGQASGAIESLRLALTLDPTQVDAYRALAEALAMDGQWDAAIASLREAIARFPDRLDFHTDMGLMLLSKGRPGEARAVLEDVVRRAPGEPRAHLALARVHQATGDMPGALAAARRTPADTPEIAGLQYSLGQQLCDWTDHDKLARRLKDAVALDTGEIPPPLTYFVAGLDTADQSRATHAFMRKHFAARLERLHRPASSARPAKIKLGYLSGDYCVHPIARVIAGLFAQHDRSRVEVFAYSLGRQKDEMTDRIRRSVDVWVDLAAQTDEAAARRIAQDDIEILIDLSGFTGIARIGIPAWRAAPIQALLHQNGTLACDIMDYFITDTAAAPPGALTGFSEAAAYCPETFVNLAEDHPAPEADPPRAAHGLPEDAFVFCAFSTPYKITPFMFDIWMTLLREIPQSVLWLREVERVAIDNLKAEAAKRGVAPERLIFAPRLPRQEYLARYRCADLFLDTLPYSCCSTAADVVWAGLPLLTCAGDTHVGRMCASVLRAAGMTDMVADSLNSYQAKALDLARNPDALRAIRARFHEARRASMLFDSRRFARQMEDLYGEMSRRWRAGESPTTIGP